VNIKQGYKRRSDVPSGIIVSNDKINLLLYICNCAIGSLAKFFHLYEVIKKYLISKFGDRIKKKITHAINLYNFVKDKNLLDMDY
jgi:hypothetical protein